MVQILRVVEEVINIDDLIRQRDNLQAAIDYDAQVAKEFTFIKNELDNTSLDEEQKNRLLGGFGFSGSGMNKSMLDELNKRISDFQSLPQTSAINVDTVVIDGNNV